MVLFSEGDFLLYLQDNIRNGILDTFFKTITHLGDGGIFWIILTVILLCFRKTRKAGICSVIALLGSVIICNLIIKNLVARTRPYEMIEGLTCIVKRASDYSFPSGHTSASFASAVAMTGNIKKRYSVVLLIVAALIAFSRLYIGIHYPTDVLGGLVLGVLLGLLGHFLGEKICAAVKNRRTPDPVPEEEKTL